MEKILIVDDSLLQGNVLKSILQEDYHIEICRNGLECLEHASNMQPSLILLDVIMPGIDGFEALVRLKAQERTKNIPVILITSLSDEGNEEKGLTLGAVDYIGKPFNPSIVKARVRTHTQLYAYRRTIENLAMLDGLLGIPNRRSYNDRSSLEWFRALRNQEPLSVGLLDIDFFKQYNDTYGHMRGDDVLVQVAGAITVNLRRSTDFTARYGGEEIAILLPDTTSEEAERIARQICHDVNELHILHEKSSVSKYLTVSIGGMTFIPQPDENYHDMFKIVDKMLYLAKKNGRNTVVWHDGVKENANLSNVSL